jgi:DNA-binding NtrC family response regulator
VQEPWRILVVDDEPVQRESMAVWLKEDGYSVDTASSGDEAVELAGKTAYDVCFVDLKMPGIDGIETMRRIRKTHPEAAVIIVTAYATVDTAITAIKEGARDYVVKPCNLPELSLQVERILEVKRLQRENVLLRKKLQKEYTLQDLTSKSPKMHEIFELVRNVASLRSTVLIQGESGTGKEVIARAIHLTSDRAKRPFVAVPCVALAESLLESELFGHERGSFTGAVDRRKGKIEMAEGGTVFLDEIADIPLKLQLDLLRVLQERRFFRVGGSEEIEVDVRFIAASNRSLSDAVHEGRFREDLFYRLNVITIQLPPLRERVEDIPLLARTFVERIATEVGKDVRDLSEGALRRLMAYDWPGNVRELENGIERAIVVASGPVLDEEDFAFLEQESEQRAGWSVPANLSLKDVEREVIQATLRRTGGNIKAAAAALGIDRSTLYEKLKRYEIPRE